jgi:DNA-binding transcriptional LysR family regulator
MEERISMNISRLHTFLTLAEYLNFTEAAEQLYCSQPSVSMQIQALEQEFGVPLFDRIGKKLYLTKHGEDLKPYAEQIVNLLQSAKDHIQQSESLSHGTLSFGASNFVGVYLLPAILGDFNQLFPGIKINMNITSSRHLLEMLESNKVEFLIISDHVPIDETRFQATTFYQDELVLITNASHRLAQQKECSPEDLVHEMILLKPKKSATRIYLESKFKEFGLSFPNNMEISSLEAIKQGVIHGLGISIVSKFAIQQELRNGLLTCISIKDVTFPRGIQYVFYKNKHLSPASRQFLASLDMPK